VKEIRTEHVPAQPLTVGEALVQHMHRAGADFVH
jgi:hypothetical protein